MIPQRMFPSEFSQGGLKSRVTACRKRLREKRVMLRSPAGGNIESLFSVATRGAERSPLEFESQQPQETVALLEEQEVGIT
jgi:hypothetical protein